MHRRHIFEAFTDTTTALDLIAAADDARRRARQRGTRRSRDRLDAQPQAQKPLTHSRHPECFFGRVTSTDNLNVAGSTRKISLKQCVTMRLAEELPVSGARI